MGGQICCPGLDDLINAITLDKKGNVYVTGGSTLGVDLDGEDYDFTTIKYNKKGEELWVKRFDGLTPGNIGDHGMAIVLDKEGNIYVTGSSARGGSERDSEYATVKYDA